MCARESGGGSRGDLRAGAREHGVAVLEKLMLHPAAERVALGRAHALEERDPLRLLRDVCQLLLRALPTRRQNAASRLLGVACGVWGFGFGGIGTCIGSTLSARCATKTPSAPPTNTQTSPATMAETVPRPAQMEADLACCPHFGRARFGLGWLLSDRSCCHLRWHDLAHFQTAHSESTATAQSARSRNRSPARTAGHTWNSGCSPLACDAIVSLQILTTRFSIFELYSCGFPEKKAMTAAIRRPLVTGRQMQALSPANIASSLRRQIVVGSCDTSSCHCRQIQRQLLYNKVCPPSPSTSGAHMLLTHSHHNPKNVALLTSAWPVLHTRPGISTNGGKRSTRLARWNAADPGRAHNEINIRLGKASVQTKWTPGVVEKKRPV
eukprot:3810525-Rhodomonas_salina.2